MEEVVLIIVSPQVSILKAVMVLLQVGDSDVNNAGKDVTCHPVIVQTVLRVGVLVNQLTVEKLQASTQA